MNRETLFVRATGLAYPILKSGASEVFFLFGWFAKDWVFEHAAYLFAPADIGKSSIVQARVYLHWLSHNIPIATASGLITDDLDQLLSIISFCVDDRVLTAVSSGVIEEETKWLCEDLDGVIEGLLHNQLTPDCHVTMALIPLRQAVLDSGYEMSE